MDKHAFQEAMASLASGRLLSADFRYYKDRYALQLLKAALPRHGGTAPLAALKGGAFAALLNKPRIAKLVRRHQGRPFTQAVLDAADHDRSEQTYQFGFDTWGSDAKWGSQCTRRGFNLVLQLNFDRAHDAAFERLVKPARGSEPYCYSGHPHSRSRNTMAWVRIDLDFAAGEALIEEVQSDWLRESQYIVEQANWALSADPRGKARRFARWGVNGSAAQVARYHEQHAAHHLGHWSEAALSAALQVLTQHLRIRRVFFHTLESGKALREMNWWSPPRSLYTDLPKQFCFTSTADIPVFLEKEVHIRKLRKTGAVPPMHLLEL